MKRFRINLAHRYTGHTTHTFVSGNDESQAEIWANGYVYALNTVSTVNGRPHVHQNINVWYIVSIVVVG